MRRVTGILVLLALAYFATACGQGPKTGTVVDRSHDAAYSYWVAGVQTPETCTMVGKVEDCTPGINIPGHMQYVPETWSLKLDDGKHKGWRDVGEEAYNACLVNEHYPECAS